jgi:hypothetical protein
MHVLDESPSHLDRSNSITRTPDCFDGSGYSGSTIGPVRAEPCVPEKILLLLDLKFESAGSAEIAASGAYRCAERSCSKA